MPKRKDIKAILIVGAGPIIIGQACEFDYSGTQACKALREEGYRVILINSNPATIMTDPDTADVVYIEPITPEIVAKIIKKESLIRACEDGHDKEARWNMMMASTEGAMAFSKGLGAVHSMSHALGANQELRLHHGTLNAVILPSVLRFNQNHVEDKYTRIARAMGNKVTTDLADEIEKLNEKIGMPASLSEMDVTEDMIPDLVVHSMTDPSNMTTPRLPSQDEWEKLFLEAM